MTWLVTGGAGYIGSHVVRAFGAAGIGAVVLDDLSSGHAEFVTGDVPLVTGTVLDRELVVRVLTEHDVRGVVHLAGFKYAGVSVQRPVHTYQQNVQGTATLLDAVDEVGVPSVVFSSSAAVYGTPDGDLVTEASPTRPESPYGESKLVSEWLFRDVAAARALAGSRLGWTALRYFNVVGSGADDLYDTSPHNLFPLVLKALSEGRTPRINGTDYATPDGTCVRDYVHVQDLALAHVEAAKVLEAGGELAEAYNLGSGDGVSVRQIMDAVSRVTGTGFEPEVGPRRPGDPDRIVASGEAAAADLGWAMRHDLDDMVASAWRAWRTAAPA